MSPKRNVFLIARNLIPSSPWLCLIPILSKFTSWKSFCSLNCRSLAIMETNLQKNKTKQHALFKVYLFQHVWFVNSPFTLLWTWKENISQWHSIKCKQKNVVTVTKSETKGKCVYLPKWLKPFAWHFKRDPTHNQKQISLPKRENKNQNVNRLWD